MKFLSRVLCRCIVPEMEDESFEFLEGQGFWNDSPPSFAPLAYSSGAISRGTAVGPAVAAGSQSAPPQPSPEYEELPEFPRRLPGPARAVNGRFRLNAAAMFLTYSQSRLERARITQWYASQRGVKRLIVGMEHHQDGNLHWHVTVEYTGKKDIRNERYFDIDGEHPNIKTWDHAVTYEQWLYNHWNYCKKEDPTPFTVGEEPMNNRKRKRDEVFTTALQTARTQGVTEAMSFLETNCPFDLVTKYEQIHRALVKIRNLSTQHQAPARAVSEFTCVPLIVDDWRTLFITGPTGTGKTAWARSLLPQATVVSHRDQLRDCDFSHGVIFDDFDVGHWPPTAVIHLLDWDEPRGLDVKHGHVIIPAHTRKIFTHNCSFDRWVSKDATDEQIEACRRRLNVVNVHARLY